jgi:FAD/FMN-containing dehydrogenase
MSALFDLKARTRVLELTPEDMTATVESGITLGALQRELAKHRQWLPIDPPHTETVSIHDLLANNLSGPRRFGYGTIREHLIGMKVVLADGRIIKSGGKVVKNVAGYDLAKLFIGARGTLGTITEAVFKLRPLPEVECFVGAQVERVADVTPMIRAVLDSEMTPVVLDLHRAASGKDISAVVGFAGTRAEVDWQFNVARTLGFTMPTALDYEAHFWNEAVPVNRLSVLPSQLTAAITKLDNRPFVARAGNGVIYYRGEVIERPQNLPTELMRRIKSAYDPENIFSELSL